ncbi:LYR motif containing protein 1 [Trypanosoma grayi]|uniref:LYR motif containing protein 1 n=1 Tax=Trypanosoma grayi TaxID=71804 RepID=UPI0004F4751F|nr:LYR motif containing protein 1 [Trypanosoma grayi]KEG08767.1 LYR motif containing protein 1 [Trypanosoma grayi]
MSAAGARGVLLRHNPYRSEVLSWYRRFLKVAFTVPWETDEDALYVMEEARRLFRQNANITDVESIRRKLREAEMRYEIGVHYRIPYPRPFHKTQGSLQESGVAYAADLDSMYDHPVNMRVGRISEGSTNFGTMGGVENSTHFLEDGPGVDDEILTERR